MCLSALLIFIYSLKIAEWVPSGRLGGPPHPRRRAQGWTPRFPPLWIPFPLFLSLAKTGERRPLRKKGTAEDFYFRIFLNLFAVSDALLLHIPATLRRRNTTVSRNSFARYCGQFLRVIFDGRLYRRVRRLGAPYQTVCTCLTVGAVNDRPQNAKSLRNSYLLTPNSYLAEALHSD